MLKEVASVVILQSFSLHGLNKIPLSRQYVIIFTLGRYCLYQFVSLILLNLVYI